MPLLEFDIIKQYFSKITTQKNVTDIHLGIGDDAAIVSVPGNEQLVVCTDTLNAGIHFPENTSAFDIGYKALAVNLSDLAAMGASPKWFTLNLSLPEANAHWLAEFSGGLQQLAANYQLELIGGDTTRGPLSISITLAGHIANSQGLLRSTAKVGDKVYMSGCTGEAAYGLACLMGGEKPSENQSYFISRLNQPSARVDLGLRLMGIATSCIDISDGLLADITHIADASDCGIKLDLNAIPLPRIDDVDTARRYALTGGDDYELVFTVPVSRQITLDKIAEQLDIPITCIGEVVTEKGVKLFDNNTLVNLPVAGYEHFSA